MTAPATKFILFFNYINKYLNINSYYYKDIIIVLSNLY